MAKIRDFQKILAHNYSAGIGYQTLTNPHENRDKLDQKLQLNKITINTRLKPRHSDRIK